MSEELDNKKHKALEEIRSIVRPELNIEKHADFIFAPSHSKNLRQPRKKMWVTELENGNKASSYLLIEPIFSGKTPSTKTRKVYLTLVKLWEERRRTDDTVVFSVREIAETLSLKWAGKRTAREIYQEIHTLRVCAFTWKYSFFDAKGNKIELLDHINIIDKFTYVSMEDRTKQSEKFQALNAIRFGDSILTNLKTNKTKPTYFETALSIKGEIAAVLYARLDIILADKIQYERTTKGLFQDLHLEGEKLYRYPSGRKHALEKAMKELNGKPISTGILSLSAEKTVDGADWKLVARKSALLQSQRTHRLPTGTKRASPNPPEMISFLGQEIGNTIGEYETKRRLYEAFGRFYPANVIYQALSEYKADVLAPKHPVRVFVAIMHRLAHQTGKDWIHPCPKGCKYRSKRAYNAGTGHTSA